MVRTRTTLILARKNKGLTQQELADHVGITRAFLANVEGGKHTPSLNVAYDIAIALECRMEDLFFEDNVRKTNIKPA